MSLNMKIRYQGISLGQFIFLRLRNSHRDNTTRICPHGANGSGERKILCNIAATHFVQPLETKPCFA